MEKIKTERLILRKPQSSDKNNLFPIFNDINVNEYIPGFYFETLEEVSFFLEEEFDFKNEFAFVIEEISSNKIIGFIHSRLFIGYVAHTCYIIKADERGKGYLPEALQAFIDYLYEKKVASSIHFTIREDNPSSLSVMKKLKIPFQAKIRDYLNYNLSLYQEPS